MALTYGQLLSYVPLAMLFITLGNPCHGKGMSSQGRAAHRPQTFTSADRSGEVPMAPSIFSGKTDLPLDPTSSFSSCVKACTDQGNSKSMTRLYFCHRTCINDPYHYVKHGDDDDDDDKVDDNTPRPTTTTTTTKSNTTNLTSTTNTTTPIPTTTTTTPIPTTTTTTTTISTLSTTGDTRMQHHTGHKHTTIPTTTTPPPPSSFPSKQSGSGIGIVIPIIG